MHADKQFRKELMSLAIPFALQWLLNALVGASDALMLGRLTQESIAAVSLANQVSFVLSLFIGAIVGAIGVLVAPVSYTHLDVYKRQVSALISPKQTLSSPAICFAVPMRLVVSLV